MSVSSVSKKVDFLANYVVNEIDVYFKTVMISLKKDKMQKSKIRWPAIKRRY